MSNSLNLIENIVVVMLENRSFDQMLGTLYPYSSQFEGLKLDGSMYNTYAGKPYPVTNTSSCNPFTITPDPDPGESFADMNLQIFGQTNPPAGTAATMGGFVNDYMAGVDNNQYSGIPTGKQCPWAPSWPPLPRVDATTKKEASPGDIMFYFTPSQLPVTSLLAKSFGVSDAWFGSCPTQTYPNRFFLNCATSGGYVNDVDYPCNLELWPDLNSIFQLLDQLLDGTGGYNNANWKVYFHDIGLATLIKYVLRSASSSQPMVCNFDTSDFGDDSKFPTFQQDVQNQTLPKYSFIEPRYGGINNLPPNDNHPPFDVTYGEILVANIYNLICGSKYYWPRTLLIITYDEHGGCFDHVVPPTAIAPGGTVLPNFNPSHFDFTRYGPRVPAILVSPYIPAGSIIRPAGFSYVQGKGTSTTNGVPPFDHTSVIRTIVECFNLLNGTANLTRRDANAPSLGDALSLNATNMNNGPGKIAVPEPPASACAVPSSSHLAEIYQAMLGRLGPA